MKKKFLILINNSIGLYKFRKELLEKLAENNDVVVSSPDNGFMDEISKIACKVYATDVDRRGINPLKDVKLFREYKRILKVEKPDMVIAYTIKPNIYGGYACRVKNIPYAVNITGLGTAFQKKGILLKLVVKMYKMALKKVRIVFFENVDNKDVIVKNGIISEKKCKVLNGAGVNLDYYKLEDYPLNPEPVHFLFIGRVMQEKGIDELFETMSRLHKEQCNCVLDVVGIHEENYDLKIEKGKNEGWLIYHGYQEDVRPFIKNSHCFVLPSWHEGMANTNLESAASGRPIITSNISGCKEAVIENVSGYLCEPQNSDSLYNMMKKFLILSNKEKSEMGLAGRKHMEQVFDKITVVNETIKLLLN